MNSISSSYINNISLISNSAPEIKTEGHLKEAEFSYSSQDSFVMQPGTTTLKDVTINKNGASTERVDMRGAKLEPNDEGKFVYDPKDKQYTAAATLATVAQTLSTFESAYGEKIDWAFGSEKIGLHPDAGEDFNAYYSRDEASLNFFHGMDPTTKEMIYSGNSGEVVSHEVGHAMLDGMRPDYLVSWDVDTNGFHEAFGDVTALLMATQDDAAVELAAKQTGGDLRKPNCLAATGEQLGATINNAYGRNATGGDYIRNAINDFKWQAPRTVPRNPSGTDPLTTEMHSWSRIWTGAQYDMLADMVKEKMNEGMTAQEAIKAAGKETMELCGGMMKNAPKSNATYRQLAQAMLKADQQMGGKNHDLIAKTFTNRNILFEGDADMMALEAEAPTVQRTITTTLEGPEFGMFSGAEVSGKADVGEFEMEDSKGVELQQNLKRLIQDGRILYTEPNQKVEHKDLFDKNGQPYAGVVRWTEGKMVIEHTTIIS